MAMLKKVLLKVLIALLFYAEDCDSFLPSNTHATEKKSWTIHSNDHEFTGRLRRHFHCRPSSLPKQRTDTPITSLSVLATPSSPPSSDFSEETSRIKIFEESVRKSSISIEEYIENAQREHDLQFQSGKETFGCSSDNGDTTTTQATSWSDEHYTTYNVKKGHAGPLEDKLENGNIIYETKEPILSEKECQEYIQAAIQTIQNEKQLDNQNDDSAGRPTARSNSDLGEARLSKLPPDAIKKLQSLLQRDLYPMLTSRFGINDLAVYDGLILGHIAPSQNQPVHRDASLLTINIPLSSPLEDYNGGGGTYIEGLLYEGKNQNTVPLCIEKGKVLCHSSGIMHAGIGIQNGQRWVMVLFIIAKDEAQIARRCHAEGLYALQNSNQLDEAMVAFQAGLLHAPRDHLLHMGVGQVASIKHSIWKNERESESADDSHRYMELLSMDCLSKASKYYPPSHKASIALGKMLLSKRRPRAALRQFDSVLSIIDCNDLVDGSFLPLKAQAWDTRICAVRCALLCCEEVLRRRHKEERDGRSGSSISSNERMSEDNMEKNTWSNQIRLEQAIERLHIAMAPVPNDDNLNLMMKRANELLEYNS